MDQLKCPQMDQLKCPQMDLLKTFFSVCQHVISPLLYVVYKVKNAKKKRKNHSTISCPWARKNVPNG